MNILLSSVKLDLLSSMLSAIFARGTDYLETFEATFEGHMQAFTFDSRSWIRGKGKREGSSRFNIVLE